MAQSNICCDPSAGFLTDALIIDGYRHRFLPSEWKAVTDNYGVRSTSRSTLDLGRVVSVQEAISDPDGPARRHRKVTRQAWQASWNDESIMNNVLYDHLMTLYTTQKFFWIRYDDVMAADYAVLNPADDKWRAYFTPTYPIKPVTWTPINTEVDYVGDIAIEGATNGAAPPFMVDEENGFVEFEEPLGKHNQIMMRYSWMCRVRISDIKLAPIEVPQAQYVGSVVFEQVKNVDNFSPWWLREAGAGLSCTGSNESEYIFITPWLTPPSLPDLTVPSFPSDGSNDSGASGSSDGSQASYPESHTCFSNGVPASCPCPGYPHCYTTEDGPDI